MKKIPKILFLVIFLALFLRLFLLGEVPPGFYSDEAAYGYNAYSILKTGKDEYGRFLPLAFESFGDWKAPLYIYFMVPYITLFGLNPWAVRVTGASLGVASVILTYFLVRKLLGSQKIALATSLFLAISPFALQFNRMAHEVNLTSFLVILGTFLFLKGLEKPKWLLGATIIFALTLYTYHNARVFSPLFVLALILIYREKLISNLKWLMVSFLVGIILVLPLVDVMFSPAGWSRVAGTNILGDPGIVMRINEERGEDALSGIWLNRPLHNKGVTTVVTFFRNYLTHFSGDFLFAWGDPVKIYQTPQNGILYWWQLPILLAGIFVLLREKTKESLLILAWFLLAPVPAALTRFVPSTSRTLILEPTLEIFLGVGIFAVFSWWQKLPVKKKYFAAIVSVLLVGFNLYYYFHFYYTHLPMRFAHEWQVGVKEMVLAVEEIQDKYEKIWVSKKGGGYIYFLFHLKYPPEKYQPQAKLGTLNEYGFGWVEGFDKYHFGNLPTIFELEKNILYVGAPEEFPDGVKPLKIIYYPDKRPAFYLVDSQGLIKK